MKENKMVINRETAMLLWNKSFGKSSKAKDFAGREMLKAAYDDRGSKYGWNVDHILPKSRGGKTTESNLICCHIKTNDEKADKFPCFTANGKKFEIVKVQNHYEIREIKPSVKDVDSNNKEEDTSINFYDSAAGIRFYKSLKCIQNKKVFVGTVIIDLFGIETPAVIDFITELFCNQVVTYGTRNNAFVVIVKDHNMPSKENTAELLDQCVLLNTYLSCYFKNNGIIKDYQIFYGIHNFDDKMKTLSSANDMVGNISYPFLINELIRINTKAQKELGTTKPITYDKFRNAVYEYDYIFTKLAENLKKYN